VFVTYTENPEDDGYHLLVAFAEASQKMVEGYCDKTDEHPTYYTAVADFEDFDSQTSRQSARLQEVSV